MASPEALRVLRELQSKPENKVSSVRPGSLSCLAKTATETVLLQPVCRSVWTVIPKIPNGQPSLMALSCAWSAVASTEALVCTSALSGGRDAGSR
jgi:hypothetical protein